jgi:hypothetical protein
MSTLREAAQQALEALESLFSGQFDPERGMRCGNAVLALRAALAQQEQEQEPVARVIDDETPEGSTEWIPYSGRQVPVKTGDLLYTHPPRREWRSLSEEEIHAALPHEPGDLDFVCARAIEAALRSKNHE